MFVQCKYNVYRYDVLFSLLWPGNFCQYLRTVSCWANSLVWVAVCYSISQLASRVGEGGGVGQLCLHGVTQPYTNWPRWREQGGGLGSLPFFLPLKLYLAPPCHPPEAFAGGCGGVALALLVVPLPLPLVVFGAAMLKHETFL
jgi:hypothetical protein